MTLLTISAVADEVLLRNGETVDGEWSVARIELESEQGEIVIPGHHLDTVSRSDGGFVVTLIDGSTVEGRLRLEAVELRTGLVLRRIPIDEVETIRIEMSPEVLVASTLAAGGFVEVDRVPLDGAIVSSPCPLRLRLRLPSRFREGGWSSQQSRVVECDDVLTISTVEVRFRRGRRSAGELVAWPHIKVEPPQDKLAEVLVTLFVDGEKVGGAHRKGVDAEEGRTTRKSFAISLPAEVVKAWTAGAEAHLEIELSAVDH